jgi:inner membrane protein
MHRAGHYGAALLVYAPVGFVAIALGFDEIALLGGAVVGGGAMLPDYDQRVPFLTHRGITHTVWFALLVGVVLGIVGGLVGSRGGVIAALGLGGFGLLAGVLLVGAHLLADALTPMGVRPLEPVDDREYCFDVATASNPIANYALLAVGGVTAGAAFLAGQAV